MSSDLADDEVYCRDCGAVISAKAEICPECGIRQRPPPGAEEDDSGSDKDPGIAAVASFLIPGLGQVYNGEIGKGIIAGFITAGLALTGIGLLIAIPVWIWLVYDAYSTAKSNGVGATEEESVPTSAVLSLLDWYRDQDDAPTETIETLREDLQEDGFSGLSRDGLAIVIEAAEAYQNDYPYDPDSKQVEDRARELYKLKAGGTPYETDRRGAS